jgi:hypothetical protein
VLGISSVSFLVHGTDLLLKPLSWASVHISARPFELEVPDSVGEEVLFQKIQRLPMFIRYFLMEISVGAPSVGFSYL